MMVTNAAAIPLSVWVGPQPDSGEATEPIVYKRTLSPDILVRVYRDAVVAFDFSKWSPGRIEGVPAFTEQGRAVLRRLELLNTYLVCLYTATQDTDNWTPQQWRSLSAMNWIQIWTIDSEDELRRIRAMLPTDSNRLSISLDAIAKSFDLLEHVLGQQTDVVQLLDLYLRITEHYQTFQHSLCLTLGWTLVEAILDDVWKRYIEQNRQKEVDGVMMPFINQNRKERLTSNDYSASMITETLSLLGVIPFDLYELLTKVRRARNGWMHSLVRPSEEDAREAVLLAKRMILYAYDVNVAVNLFTISRW
jgi:hypothetical protein